MSRKDLNPNHGREAAVGIQFHNLTKEQMDKLYQASSLLSEIGIGFDTGGTVGDDERRYDWEWDWSLTGPVKVVFRNFVDEDPMNRYVRGSAQQPGPDDSSIEAARRTA